jgi:exopolysaccharide production protein ExoZ
MNRLFGVQYLRAIAALGVVAFHAAERAGGHFVIGAAGVDIFFVVSGFIMWVIAEVRHPSPAAFLRDRVERIAPAYWFATGVMVAGGLAGLFPNMRLTFPHVFGSLAFLPHTSPSDGQIWPVLVQGWTLNYEIFFYVLFALTLTIQTGRRLPILTCLFTSLVAIGLLFQPQDALLKTYTSPLLLEFLLGCGIGKLWLEGRMPPPAIATALILVAVAGFAFVGITYTGFNAFVLGPAAGALLIGVLALEKNGLIPHFPTANYLGDASYSIYLWHTMAISVVAKLGALLGWPPSIVFGMAMICGTAVGLVAYETLEKPIALFLKLRRIRA